MVIQMEMMTERGFELHDGEPTRIFENGEWTLTRPFFENGVVDYGYSKLQFDLSDCKFGNEITLNPEELEDDFEELSDEPEEEPEIIELF